MMKIARLIPYILLGSSVAIANANNSKALPDVNPNVDSFSVDLFAAEALSITNATRVYYANQSMANKLLISYHGQLLEINKAEGYAIIQLEAEEKAKLKDLGFRLADAKGWIANRQQQLAVLAQNHLRKNALKQDAQLKQVNDDTIDGYPCYSTVEGTFARAELLAQNYPNLANWVDIGDSWSKSIAPQTGYDIKVLQITNSATDSDDVEKPILFVHSAMHAREYTTAELTTRFAEHLLNQYDHDADISWIIDHHQVHIVFHMNPDGRKRAEGGLFWRKNINANYCTNDSMSRGADLNRNFSFFWNSTTNGSSGHQCSDVYRGPTAGSEPETQAIENYIRSIFVDSRGPDESDAAPDTTTGIHIDVHSAGELMLWPWGHRSYGAPNEVALRTLGRKLAYFNGYTPMQGVGLYPTDGTSDDVSYGELGVAAFTFELGTNFFQDCSSFEESVYPDNLKSLVYAAKVVNAPYLVPAGPDATLVKVNDEVNVSITLGETVTVSAAVNDGRYENSQGNEPVQGVVAAEYYINQLPWQAGATAYPLTALDGEVGGQIEVMQAQLNTEGMATGRYGIYVRGQDTNGQWGPVSATYMTLTAQGEEPQNQPPIASFNAACSGLFCSFDATGSSDSDGAIANYHWDLADGTVIESSGATSVEHYFAPGSYQVELTVTDDKGATDSQLTQVDAVNLAPEASFSVDCNGAQCQFDASSSRDSDGSIAEYEWNFADGTVVVVTSPEVVSHSFAPGSYQVQLTVSDNYGAQHSYLVQVEITNSAPQADFSFSCTQGSCDFDATNSSDSDGEVVAYQWQVGEQTLASTDVQVTHTFTQSGDYQVMLTVTDNNQAVDSITKSVTVTVSHSSGGSGNNSGGEDLVNDQRSSGGGSLSFIGLLGLFSLWLLRLLSMNGVVGHYSRKHRR